MDVEEIKKLIKENLQIIVSTESKGSECTYREQTFIKLIFCNETISKTEIEKLGENR